MNRRARRIRASKKAQVQARQTKMNRETLQRAIEDGATDRLSRKLSASYILLTQLLHLSEEMEEDMREYGMIKGKTMNLFDKSIVATDTFLMEINKLILDGEQANIVQNYEDFSMFFRKWAGIEEKKDIAFRIKVMVARETKVKAEDITSRKNNTEIRDARLLYWLCLDKKGFSAADIASISGYTEATVNKQIDKTKREIEYTMGSRIKDIWLEIKKYL